MEHVHNPAQHFSARMDSLPTAMNFEASESSPFMSSASSQTLGLSHDNTQSVHPPRSRSKLELLRKRQLVVNRSTASSPRVDPYTNMSGGRYSPGLDDDWISEVVVPTEDSESDIFPRKERKESVRSRRRPSTNHQEPLFSSPHRMSPKSASGSSGRRSGGKSDQRWIALLERNNEELMSQITTLTTDLSETEQMLKAKLKDAEHEIWSLREQLTEKDKLHRRVFEQHKTELSSLRSKLGDGRIRSQPGSQATRNLDTDSTTRALVRERELYQSRMKKKDDELLRIKRRNAELAEQILHKRGLEMTVEGQNRYLFELSTALDETRKTSASEPSSSPRFQDSSELPTSPVLPPFLFANSEARTRPMSFDGTRWSNEARHTRHHSLMELGEVLNKSDASRRPKTTASDAKSTEPPSPPLTDRDLSPLIDCADFIHDKSAAYDAADTFHFKQLPYQRRKNQGGRPRPSLQRNESSLWSELCQEHQVIDEGFVDGLDSSLMLSKMDQNNETEKINVSNISPEVQQCELHDDTMQGVRATPRVNLATLTYNWFRFLVLLLAAVALLVLEGPTSLLKGD